MAARVWALTTDCLVNSCWKMFMFMPYKFPTFIFEPAFRKIRGYLGKLWKLVKHLHNNFLCTTITCVLVSSTVLLCLAICKEYSSSTFKNDDFFVCTGNFITTERFVGFCSSFELDCKKKILLLRLFPSKDDFLVMEPFVDRVAEVEFVFQVLSLLAKNDLWQLASVNLVLKYWIILVHE